MSTPLDPGKKLLRARVQLQNKAYFIYHILFYAKYRIASPEEAEWCKTAYADVVGNIVVAADFIKDENDRFIEGLLYHEAVHLVLMHPILCKGRIRELWNLAADIKCNEFVKEGGYSLIPGAVAANRNGDFDLKMPSPNGLVVVATVKDCGKKSSIRIYDELYEQLKKAGRIKTIIMAGGCYGDGKDPKEGLKDPGLSEKATSHHEWEKKPAGKTDKEITKELKDRIRDAYTSAKAQGKMPSGLERSVEELLESRTNWKYILKKSVISAMPYEPSYRLPHKRSFSVGVYLPHIEKESADVIISIDTSGSINQRELTAFLSELVAMSRQCHNLNMVIIICDAIIHEIYPIRNGNIGDIMAIKMKGGGGTSHLPVFEYCKKHRKAAKLLINFTDGFTTFPEKKDVNIETLWVLTKRSVAPEKIPFGHVIRLETA